MDGISAEHVFLCLPISEDYHLFAWRGSLSVELAEAREYMSYYSFVRAVYSLGHSAGDGGDMGTNSKHLNLGHYSRR